MQFLAEPHIPDVTCTGMRDAQIKTCNYGTILGKVISVCWDTNTGWLQGSASLFEQEMDRAILWLACHYHIGELYIEHADVEVSGAFAGILAFIIHLTYS